MFCCERIWLSWCNNILLWCRILMCMLVVVVWCCSLLRVRFVASRFGRILNLAFILVLLFLVCFMFIILCIVDVCWICILEMWMFLWVLLLEWCSLAFSRISFSFAFFFALLLCLIMCMCLVFLLCLWSILMLCDLVLFWCIYIVICLLFVSSRTSRF